MNRAFIGIGSNIEPREKYIEQALQTLGNHEQITIVAKSSIYETAPVGYVDQNEFLNIILYYRDSRTTISESKKVTICDTTSKRP